MRKFSFVVIALFAVASSFAQKKLNIKDITPELSVYPCQDRYEALVVIRCSEDFELEFKSNVDRELSITRELEGTEKIYNIVFKTREEGTSFKGRMLSIMAPAFDKIYRPLELKQKEKKEFIVTDPYSSLRSPFYTYLEKGNELFTEGMYGQAKDQYHMAQRCPEYSEFDNTISQYLALCDSMISWTEIVDEAEKDGDYYRARDYLAMMTNNNAKCVALRDRYNNVMREYAIRCNADMVNGEQYMLDGYYEKAKAVYQNAVAMRNPRIAEAELKLHEIEKLTYKKTHKTRTFFYQSMNNCPIGFTSAGCMPSKSAGYFSMNFNKSCIDLLTNTNERFDEFTMDYEINVSAGWTVPMYKSYAFLYFTPFSYTGGGCSFAKVGENNSDENMFKALLNQDVRWYHAVSPEIGIIVKYWRVALNYKYKYRYWIGDCDGLKDVLGSSVHSFGIGFAW